MQSSTGSAQQAELSDRQLVADCLTGDRTAIGVLVERYERPVFAICYRMLHHRQDAEDASQEVFLRALRSLRCWDRERPLRNWLFAIAVNHCRSLFLARARQGRSFALLDHLPDTACPTESADLAEELHYAIGRLAPNHRWAFLLFHEQQLSCKEVAAVLGCPEGTVKVWLHRARQQLAAYLTRRGVVPESRHALR